MRNVVFMINTEYHAILTTGIILQYFKNCKIYVYKVAPIGGKRLNNINFRNIGVEYREIIYDYKRPTGKLKEKLNGIVDLAPTEFVFFLENKFWMNYLFSKLHRIGTKIILAPDGMKVYANHEANLKSRFLKFLKGVYHIIRSNMYETLPHVERFYATSKYIDEVWVENSTNYVNNTRKKVFEFQLPCDNMFNLSLTKVFQTKEKEFERLKGKTILFVDAPIASDIYYERTIEILMCVKQKCPNRTIVIKSHPRSSLKASEKYGTINDVNFLDSNYPVELFIAKAEDAIIVSLISTGLLFYNSKCKYFWIYPLYKDIVDYSHVVNPTKHISVLHNIADL